MRILLIGEYSNVHATLAKGLRELGHRVTIASNGDFWKDYPRDIDLQRKPGTLGSIAFIAKVMTTLPRLRGYDIVQLINPMFLELKAERLFPIYKYLRRNNRKVILGAFGMDYYWVNECITRMPLRYSDFNIGDKLRADEDAMKERRDWIGTAKERLNKFIADDCDAIVTGLYEYYACYEPNFPRKTSFIPFPIVSREHTPPTSPLPPRSPRVFIGISKNRSAYKGTDIMLRAAEDLKAKYPDRMELQVANGVPFKEYTQLLNAADIILDQLYSYTPAMNALEAMARGTIVVGGGEPENYEILGEQELRPIVNVQPTYESVYHELEQLILHPEHIQKLKQQSIEYIRRYHDHIKVAKQYETLYNL